MSTHEQQTSTIPTSVVRNTGGKSGPQNLEEPASNEALRELCDKNYHQLLPLIAEKMQKEKEQQDKLKARGKREKILSFVDPPKGTLVPKVQLVTAGDEEVAKRWWILDKV
ncbi:hypothetical protein Tco_0647825 [Tanacetum coccineum]